MTRRDRIALGLPLLLVALIYAPGFAGYWIGDDLTNLHHHFVWAAEGRLWSDTFARFFQGISQQGSAYRPLSILSMSGNFALAGSHYAGWYAVNYAVHLGNTLMIGLLVLRFGRHLSLDAGLAAALAAALFGLAPTLAEGVYWISARADGWVSLLTLCALYLWIGPRDAQGSTRWMAPVALALLALALGFKESAAVYPLQLTLVALAWPGRLGSRRWAVVLGGYLLLAGFFAWRAHLFGHLFAVYVTPGAAAESIDYGQRLSAAIASLGPWWSALTGSALRLPVLYPVTLLLVGLLGAVCAERSALRLALALFAASAGMALATVLNLGGLLPHGEGGRLSYGPIVWAALGYGVLLAGARAGQARQLRLARAGLVIAVATGGVLLLAQLQRVRTAQQGLATLVAALPDYLQRTSGYTLLLVTETDGQVVLMRNGQGAIALPPLQSEGLLHRVLPTLPGDVASRHAQIAGGMLTQFQQRRFQHLEGAEVARLFDPAPPSWPDHYACWSQPARRIIEFPAPDPQDAQAWALALQIAMARCGID